MTGFPPAASAATLAATPGEHKDHHMIRRWALILTAFAVTLAAGDARAQTYPTRTIRLIAPYAPGGIADIAARLVGQKLSEAWGQQVVTENRPGANGFLGVTAERAREGNSPEGDDMASTPRRSRDIPGIYAHCEHTSSQNYLKFQSHRTPQLICLVAKKASHHL